MKFRKLCLALMTVLIVCTVVCTAQNDGMTIKFVQSEPDENGVFTLSASFEKMRFLTFQFAVRYDKEAVVPYDTQTESEAENFATFAETVSHKGLNAIGETLDVQRGLFTFTGYMMPGSEVEGAEKAGDEALTGENFGLYTFTFKLRDKEADPKFEIAFNDGNGVYFDYFPQGASVNCFDGTQTGTVVFEKNGEEQKIPFDSVKYSPPPVMTKARRLENTLYLQSSNYAAAKDGVLKIIERDNKSVTPKNGKTEMFVPLRFVCESFGLEITWDNEKRTSIVKNGESVYEVNPDNGTVIKDTTPLEMSENAYISENRIFVTLSAAAEITGTKVWYDDLSKAAILTTGEEWQSEREAEKEALSAMQFVTSPFVKIFG